MTKVLVLYYSSYGHIETMARAVADGVRDAGAVAVIKRVPELVPDHIAQKAGYKRDQPAEIATVAELADYDAIIFGTPTRFGNMASQMKNFLDQCGGLWFENKLVGKVGSVFTSTGSQHGGQESTILSVHNVLFHLGMVIAGLPYTSRARTGWTRSPAAPPTVPQHWPMTATAAIASPAPMNSPAPAFRGAMSARSPVPWPPRG